MFDDKKNSTPQPGSLGGETPKHVEDMFSETDKAASSVSALQAKHGTGPGNKKPGGGQKIPLSPADMSKYIKIGAIAIVAIIVIGGGWYAFSMFSGGGDAVPAANIGEENLENKEGDKVPEVKEEDNVVQPVTKTQPIVAPLDTDKDGLPDEEELRIGTKIDDIDSDDDYLFDREEVRVYKSDPLNPDTDGDGFLDGLEVRDGYNPNGDGKLFGR